MKKHCSCCCCCCCLSKNNNNNNNILINKCSTTSLKSDKTNRMNLRRQTIIFMTCFMNLGLTWLTGFFLIIPIENEYIRTGISFLFCLFNSMQGFFLFTIYILVSKARRNKQQLTKYSTQNNNKLKRMKHFLSPPTTITTKTNDSSATISHVYYNQSNDTEIYSLDDYSKL